MYAYIFWKSYQYLFDGILDTINIVKTIDYLYLKKDIVFDKVRARCLTKAQW